MENMTGQQTGMPVGEAMPMPATEPQPAAMPVAAPAQPVEQQIAATPMQPMPEVQQQTVVAQPVVPQVERMQIEMQPIDLTGQQPAAQPQAIMSEEGGDKKKLMIISGVVVALLVVGVGGFFAWQAMNKPEAVVMPVEQPVTIPTDTPAIEEVVIPAAPEPDAILVIEQELNAFNATGMDAELQADLSAVSGAL